MRYTTGKTVGRSVLLALVGILGLCWERKPRSYPMPSSLYAAPGWSDAQVVSGIYATTVNIHNPQPEAVKFRKKAVISLPQRQDPGPIAQFVEEELPPDGALGMDCRDIRTLLPCRTARLHRRLCGYPCRSAADRWGDARCGWGVYCQASHWGRRSQHVRCGNYRCRGGAAKAHPRPGGLATYSYCCSRVVPSTECERQPDRNE